MLDEFKVNPTPERYLALASEFTRRTGLLTPRLEPVVQTLEAAGFTPAMLMFGEGVYTLVPESLVSQVTSLLARFQKGARLLVTPIDPQGGRVSHVL